MAAAETSNQTILLDIYQRLGGIEAKLDSLKKVEDKLNEIEKRTQKLEQFDGKIGSIVIACSTFVGMVAFFLAEGIKYLFHKFGIGA